MSLYIYLYIKNGLYISGVSNAGVILLCVGSVAGKEFVGGGKREVLF